MIEEFGQSDPVLDLAESEEGSPSNVILLRAVPPSRKREVFTYANPQPSSDRDSGYIEPEYPLRDIGAAEDTDSYVFQAILKKLALAMKEGYTFVGKNKQTIDYINKRLAQIEVAQGQPFWDFLAEIFANLFRYHTCDIVKSRDVETSGGRVRKVGASSLKPVAAYFVASPETMLPKLGKDYRIKKWKHVMPDGRYKYLNPEDVIRVTVNKKSHFLMATPPWHPVIDDITALRRIEEHVENLIYQHIYPLYSYRIGDKDHPVQRYEDGSDEIQVVEAKIRNMPTDGMIVMPWRHEIKGLGSESRALRAESYIKHFKERVIAGTGMSQLDFGLGDTSNRSTADSMSKIATGNVKFIQQALTSAINFYILRELLLESTFKFDVLAEDNVVHIKFNEIDIESQIKIQNHLMLLFQNNMITRTEARNLSGWDAMPEEDIQDTHLERVDGVKAEREGELQMKTAEVTAKAAENKAAQNKQQPTNQHGKKSGPEKRRSSVEDGVAADEYNSLVHDIKKMPRDSISIGLIGQLFNTVQSRVKDKMAKLLNASLVRGASIFPLNSELIEKLRGGLAVVVAEMERDIERLMKDAATNLTKDLLNKEETLSIDRVQYRASFIERTLSRKAYIIGKTISMQYHGVQRVRVLSDPDGEDHQTWNGVVIELANISYRDLPPFHPNCNCDITPIEG